MTQNQDSINRQFYAECAKRVLPHIQGPAARRLNLAIESFKSLIGSEAPDVDVDNELCDALLGAHPTGQGLAAVASQGPAVIPGLAMGIIERLAKQEAESKGKDGNKARSEARHKEQDWKTRRCQELGVTS